MTNRESGWRDASDILDSYSRYEDLLNDGRTAKQARKLVEGDDANPATADSNNKPYIYVPFEQTLDRAALRSDRIAKIVKAREAPPEKTIKPTI